MRVARLRGTHGMVRAGSGERGAYRGRGMVRPLPAPADTGAAPHSGCAGPPRCLVSAGGGRRAIGREQLPGAPASEPPGLTRRDEPGRAGGEGAEARPPTGAAAPLRPPPRPKWGVRPGSPRGGPPAQGGIPALVSAEGLGQGAWQPRTRPGRGSPAAGASVRGSGSLTRFPPLCDAAGGDGRSSPAEAPRSSWPLGVQQPQSSF